MTRAEEGGAAKALGAADRRGVLLERTQSICPGCRRTVAAEVRERANRVFLRKRCERHGLFESLVYGDARRYAEIQRYNKPGDRPLELQTESSKGCPHDCGICPEHQQHSCLGIIEVNTACNLDCPICFAESGTGAAHAGGGGFSLSLGEVERMLDAFVAAEGEPEAVQLSGGEPSELREVAARGFMDRGPGLPGPLHPRRAQASEVLRRRDRPRWPPDPLLRSVGYREQVRRELFARDRSANGGPVREERGPARRVPRRVRGAAP
jgi:hypothetical protein